jgi:hypothetical protein
MMLDAVTEKRLAAELNELAAAHCPECYLERASAVIEGLNKEQCRRVIGTALTMLQTATTVEERRL